MHTHTHGGIDRAPTANRPGGGAPPGAEGVVAGEPPWVGEPVEADGAAERSVLILGHRDPMVGSHGPDGGFCFCGGEQGKHFEKKAAV